MSEQLEQSIKRLWLAYKLYGEVSDTRPEADIKKFADQSTTSYLKYVTEMCESYPQWKDQLPQVVENQVRIIRGFVECYDRPIKRDKITSKTRWSV